jgi:hypothetical protein
VNNIPPNQATACGYYSNEPGRNPSTRNSSKNNCGVEKHRTGDDADTLPMIVLRVGRIACLPNDNRNRVQERKTATTKQKPGQ